MKKQLQETCKRLHQTISEEKIEEQASQRLDKILSEEQLLNVVSQTLDLTPAEFELQIGEGDVNTRKWQLDMLEAELHPHFDENIYFTIPWCEDMHDEGLEVTLSDKNSKSIGEVQKLTLGNIIQKGCVEEEFHFTDEIHLRSSFRVFFLATSQDIDPHKPPKLTRIAS